MAPGEMTTRERITWPALGGRLGAVSLFDLCQFLMLNRKTGTLTVRTPEGTAYFTFHEGQLLSATDETLRDGESIVLRAVQWRDGTFEFAPGPVPPDRRIQASTESILLEAARQIDEMAATGEDDGAGPSAAQLFLEKQERAAGLSETFRRVVALGDADQKGRGWRDAVRAALRRPGAWRLRLGPGARVAVLHRAGLEEIVGADAGAVVAWAEELAPSSRGSDERARRGRARRVHVTPDREGGSYWSVRHRAPDGDWVLASLALADIPSWYDLGLPDPLFHELQAQSEGWTLMLAPADGSERGEIWPGTTALAAWLARRATERPEIAWVVESLPRYEWSRLPGRVGTVAPEQLARPGGLEELVRSSQAGLVALADAPTPMLIEALALHGPSLRVVVLASAIGPGPWFRGLARRLGPGQESAWIEAGLGAVWTIQSGSLEAPLPLASRLAVPARTRPASPPTAS